MRRELANLVLGSLVAAVWAGCNAHPVTPLGDTLSATTTEQSLPLDTKAVDILWIVDNSGSMADEQVELGARFGEFIDELAALDLDFHLAVTTTDVGNDRGRFRTGPGRVQRPGDGSTTCSRPPVRLDYCQTLADRPYLRSVDYVDAATGDLDINRLRADFECIASTGDCGDGLQEAGLEAMRLALSPEAVGNGGANEGFLRDDAYLSVILLTDEEDCSAQSGWRPTSDCDCYAAEKRGNMEPTDTYYNFLIDLKEGVELPDGSTLSRDDAESRIIVAGIIGPSDGLPPISFSECNNGTPRGPRLSCTRAGVDGAAPSIAFDGERYREFLSLFRADRRVEESICQNSFTGALRKLGQVIRANLDFICVSQRPEQCENDRECSDGVGCINPGDPALGLSFCSDFEMSVEVETAGTGEFRTLRSPGPAGESDGSGEFDVVWDTVACPTGLAFRFVGDSRPETGARYRVSYPAEVVIETGSQTDSTVTE